MKTEIKNVHIETNTFCNAKCIFCPTPKMTDRISMDKELFCKIIDDLASFDFSGKVLPYLRNEPLTDSYMFDRLKYLRQKLPDATILFSTNGLALNRGKILKLLDLQPIMIKISLAMFSKDQCLKIMGVDNTKILKNINLLFQEGSKRNIEKPRDKFRLVMVNAPESEHILMRNYLSKRGMKNFFNLELWGLVNRAGSVNHGVFGRQIYHKKIKGCNQGSNELNLNINNWFNILADGKVVLCCMDWNEEVILGDMNIQSIKEVWESERYKEVLDMVFGRVQSDKTFICKRCSSAVPQTALLDKVLLRLRQYILQLLKDTVKKYKPSGLNFYKKDIYGKPDRYIESYFDKYRNELSEKINYILRYNETDAGLSPGDQEEQALPGFEKYVKTGYYKYMLGRYLYAARYVKSKAALDSGCGLGWGSYLISDYPREITSVDINEKALDFAKEKWNDAKLNFQKCSVLDLDSLNKKFDVILGFELIEHLTLNEGKRYLKQTFDNLNKRGILILSSYFPDSEEEAKLEEAKNKYHLKIFTKSELEKFAKEAGFRKVKFIGYLMAIARK